MQHPITQQRVLDSHTELPAFPRVIEKILAALEDPDATLSLLASYIEHDPVLAGRVLSLANRAGLAHGAQCVTDVFTAISLVGLSKVREVAIMVSLAGFVEGIAPSSGFETFWNHSLAVAVCGVELARSTPIDVSVDESLIAGLLHDIGQLWLQRFEPTLFQEALDLAKTQALPIEMAETGLLGVDHGTIGAWLAQGYGLSPAIVQAIAHHHHVEGTLVEPVVAVVHVSEVLSNALDLTERTGAHVSYLSHASCRLLGLDWGEGTHALFGRIDARSRHARALFGDPA